jgi:hypothetical protein
MISVYPDTQVPKRLRIFALGSSFEIIVKILPQILILTAVAARFKTRYASTASTALVTAFRVSKFELEPRAGLNGNQTGTVTLYGLIFKFENKCFHACRLLHVKDGCLASEDFVFTPSNIVSSKVSHYFRQLQKKLQISN